MTIWRFIDSILVLAAVGLVSACLFLLLVGTALIHFLLFGG